MNINIPLTLEEIERINAILNLDGPSPAYAPGSEILGMEFDLPDAVGYLHIMNNDAEDLSVIHHIRFSIYDAMGEEIHDSRQRITNLDDQFVICPRTGGEVTWIRFGRA